MTVPTKSIPKQPQRLCLPIYHPILLVFTFIQHPPRPKQTTKEFYPRTLLPRPALLFRREILQLLVYGVAHFAAFGGFGVDALVFAAGRVEASCGWEESGGGCGGGRVG